MSRFAAVLGQISERLDLPQPVKSRILLEIAGDMEDLYRHHLEQGLEEARAEELAEDSFVVSDDALRHLVRIHESSHRFSDRMAQQAGSWWEKGLLAVWVLGVLTLVAGVASQEDFFVVVSPFLWVLVGLAAVVFVFSLFKLRGLFSKRPPDIGKLRSGLGVLLFLAGLSLVVSVCGFFFHLRWYAFQTWEGGAEAVVRMFTTWTLAVSAMMIVGLLTAILAALMWFLLVNLVARVERREVDALLAG